MESKADELSEKPRSKFKDFSVYLQAQRPEEINIPLVLYLIFEVPLDHKVL